VPVVDPRPALAAFAPPEGWRFACGVVVTHDCHWSAVVDHLVPTLAGVTATGSRRRAEARAALGDDPVLLVVHAAGHLLPGPAVPGVAAVPLGGRPLHARAALLQFRRGRRVRTRVVVGSADLTVGGLLRDRELLAWDEAGPADGQPFLGSDLLTELRRLAGEVPDTRRATVVAVLASLRDGLRTVRTGELRSSLTRREALVPAGRARRIVVVSPAGLPSAAAGAGELLAGAGEEGAPVEWYFGVAATAEAIEAGALVAPTPSAGPVERLRDRGHEVVLRAVPEIDARGRRRRLHATVVALDDGTWCDVLVGSAAVERGLAGDHRDLVVTARVRSDELDAFLGDLPWRPWRGPLHPATVAGAGDEEVAAPDVRAVFRLDPGNRPEARSWWGTLDLHAGAGPVGAIRYLGAPVPVVARQRFRLDPDRAAVEVDVAGRTHVVVVEVEGPPGEAGFWLRFEPEHPGTRRDRSLETLLGDLSRAPAAPQASARSGRAVAAGAPPDYRIELTQRPVLLARYRSRLAELDPHDAEDQIAGYLAEESEEAARVARAVHGHYAGVAPPADPLLRSLADALPAFDHLRPLDGG
jgi:hypothetical protein